MTTPESPERTDIPESAQSQGGRSPWWLALRVIDEPGAVFRALAVRPRVLVPLVLIVVAVAIQMFTLPTATLERVVRQQMENVQARNPDRITDEQIDQRVARASSPAGRATGIVTQSLFWLIGLAAAAGILTLVFGAVGSEPLRFKDEMAIVSHAFVPQLIGFVLVPLLVRFGGFEQPNLSLGFLVDPESGLAYAFASQFGLFAVWNVILVALGNQIRTGAKAITGALTIVGVLWILKNVVMAAAISTLGGMAG